MRGGCEGRDERADGLHVAPINYYGIRVRAKPCSSMNSRPWNIGPAGSKECPKFAEDVDQELGAPQECQLQPLEPEQLEGKRLAEAYDTVDHSAPVTHGILDQWFF